MSQKIISHSPEETRSIAGHLAQTLRGEEVICFSGELGAGKTTFISGLISYFLPHARVLSPTFTLIRTYQTNHPVIKEIFHLDLYRLHDAAALDQIGISEMLHRPDGVTLIEWPERLETKDIGDHRLVSLERTDDQIHTITY